ncbi:aminoglycoside phosphotransferase family protein [Bacillus altitudinis]|uniref:aminoglycoside phosphotransferase family protein n=1 Tax=Bacillus altitudinis TaxID=293387 RepID=UPI0022803735|nr:aminoglycoside phosphotransferase family protein [Bacillus altitudinis]MCY7531833.1 aminoglycoside phosphotransferase family protein [Bacillus altitudinis]
MNKTDLVQHIPLLKKAISIDQIDKGYSRDEKWVVTMSSGEKYVLRFTDQDQYDKIKTQFELLSQLRRHGVQCANPVKMGVLDETQQVYYILSFVEGQEAKEIMSQLTEEQQYAIGVSAGQDLRNMHTYPAPSHIEPWEERVVKKHLRYLAAYRESGISIEGDEKVAQFIAQHIDKVKGRPNQFQHDDFHLGNIIIKNNNYAGVIDFNNFDWGDPFHDFYKVALFSRETSEAFAAGQINGYFDGEIPADFWQLYSVYVAMSIFSSIMWVIKFDPGQMDEMIKRLENVLKDHDYFRQIEPHWYTRITR